MTRFLSNLIGMPKDLFQDNKKSGRTFEPVNHILLKLFILLISFIGILTSILILAYLFIWNMGLNNQNIPKTLIILSGICALITSLFCLIIIVKNYLKTT